MSTFDRVSTGKHQEKTSAAVPGREPGRSAESETGLVQSEGLEAARPFSSAYMAQLQRTIGNRATGVWMKRQQNALRPVEAAAPAKSGVQRKTKPSLQFKSGAFVQQLSVRGAQVVQREWQQNKDHYVWDERGPDGLLWRMDFKGNLYYELDGISSAALAGDLTYRQYAGVQNARSREAWLSIDDIPWSKQEVSEEAEGAAEAKDAAKVEDNGEADDDGGTGDAGQFQDAAEANGGGESDDDGDAPDAAEAKQTIQGAGGGAAGASSSGSGSAGRTKHQRRKALRAQKLNAQRNKGKGKKRPPASGAAAAATAAGTAAAAPARGADSKDSAADRRARIEQLAKLVDFDPDSLENILDIYPGQLEHYIANYQSYLYVDPDDAKGQEGFKQQTKDMKAEFEAFEVRAENEPDPGAGRRSKNDWASPSVRSDAAAIAEDAKDESKELFGGGLYTLHHKVSQKQLRNLYKMMNEAKDPAAKGLESFLETEMKRALGTESILKNLMSMPGNLEVGPVGSNRIGDPGDKFDGNYRDGKATPRTEQLEVVDNQISSGKIDWKDVTERLQEVQRLQQQQLLRDRKKRGVLTKPYAEQWKKGKDNKFTRG